MNSVTVLLIVLFFSHGFSVQHAIKVPDFQQCQQFKKQVTESYLTEQSKLYANKKVGKIDGISSICFDVNKNSLNDETEYQTNVSF